MKALLVSKGLWSPIESNIDSNIQQQENDNVVTVTSPRLGNDSDISTKCQKALALITLAVQSDLMIHLEQCKTAKEAWIKLQTLYAEPSTANRMRLLEQFLTLKLGQGSSVANHIHTFSSTRSQLRAIDVKIEDNLYKRTLLRSLSSRFEGLTIAIEAQIDHISTEELHARILREDTCQTSTDISGAQAFAAQPTDPGKIATLKNKKIQVLLFWNYGTQNN